MIGKRFGRLLVLAEDKRDSNGNIYYRCLCDCGKEKVIAGRSLRFGSTKSCGCYNHDIITKANPKYKTKLYGVYQSIKSRCNCPGDRAYRNYGGRGIKLSPEWAESNGYKVRTIRLIIAVGQRRKSNKTTRERTCLLRLGKLPKP